MSEAANAAAELPSVAPIGKDTRPIETAEAFEPLPVKEAVVAAPTPVPHEETLPPIPSAKKVDFPDFKNTKNHESVLSQLRSAFDNSKSNTREAYSGKTIPGGLPLAVGLMGSMVGCIAQAPGVAYLFAAAGVTVVEFIAYFARRDAAFNMSVDFIKKAEEIANTYTKAFNAQYAQWQKEKYAEEIKAAKPLVDGIDARVKAGHALNSEHMRKVLEVPGEALENASPSLQITALQIRHALYNVRNKGDFPIPTYKALSLDPASKVHEGVLLTALKAEKRPLPLGDKLVIHTVPALEVKADLYEVPRNTDARSTFIMDYGKEQFQRALNASIVVPDAPEPESLLPDNLIDTIEAYEVSHPQLDLPVLARG